LWSKYDKQMCVSHSSTGKQEFRSGLAQRTEGLGLPERHELSLVSLSNVIYVDMSLVQEDAAWWVLEGKSDLKVVAE
jgi:hypothetical protein